MDVGLLKITKVYLIQLADMTTLQLQPKVSIIIPVFNGANYMREAIDSALSQTYANIEVIVVNDGSCDNGVTESIALSYGERIRYFSKTNGGVSSALNLGISHMLGEYFSWLSHDDIYLPSKIQEQVEFLKLSNCDNLILYSDFEVFYEDGESPDNLCSDGVMPQLFRPWLTAKSSLHGCTLLIPKNAFDNCGYFNEELRATQDYDLWFRLSHQYSFIHLKRSLVRSRQHGGQGIHSMPKRVYEECNVLHLGFVNQLLDWEVEGFFGGTVAFGYLQMAKSMWIRGYDQAADKACLRALRSLNIADIAVLTEILSGVLKQRFGGAVIRVLVSVKRGVFSQLHLD